MTLPRRLLLAFALAVPAMLAAQTPEVVARANAGPSPDYLKDLAPYKPEQQVTGTVRNWGNNYIPKLMQSWEDAFQKFQPGVKFTTKLPGTEASIAGLYGGIADLAFVGREGYRPEIDGFFGRFGYEPLGIEISSGSFATPHKTFSLEVYTHKDNPLQHLTMAQAEAIFGCGCADGSAGPKPIRTWGELGLTGAWATRPIHVYGYQFETGMAGYFNRVVLHDSGKWNAELKDFDNGRDSKGEVINAGVYILQALEKDPDGIAFANPLYANGNVKMLALSESSGGPYVEPSKTTAWQRTYPIHRFTTVYLNRKPGTAIDPAVKEFLRFLLSRDGMELVVKDGAYLPLNREAIEAELKKLD